jgi:hypothetical protein
MALNDYAALQATALRWMERTGVDTAEAPDWIALAEARLNRELGAVETDTTLTGVVGSRSISLSGLGMVQPIALFISEVGSEEEFLTPKADGTFEYSPDSRKPRIWSIDGSNIDFDSILNQAYPFRFRYRQRFALSDSETTNWLLTNHPDLYLAATLMWGAGYNQDWQNGAVWKQTLEQTIPEVKNQIAQLKRAVATVDVALTYPGRSWRYGYDGVS